MGEEGEEGMRGRRRIEIAFRMIRRLDVAALELCSNAKEVSLIECGLESMEELWRLAAVERLCLPSNRISEIGLKGRMANLVELFLQNNQIAKLDGISCAPKLRRLWLTSNMLHDISQVARLHDLRELWLQDNRLVDEDLWTLKDSNNLTCLDMTGNPIRSTTALVPLTRLPALVDLSFADPHFLPSPVSSVPGYRQEVLFNCEQLAFFDGVEVEEEERRAIRDEMLHESLMLDERVRRLNCEYEEKYEGIEVQQEKVTSLTRSSR
eukprot:756781-Hanusia_phi.AAC.1